MTGRKLCADCCGLLRPGARAVKSQPPVSHQALTPNANLLTQINWRWRERDKLALMTTFDEKTLNPLRTILTVREAELISEISAARQADIAAADDAGIATTDVGDMKDQAGSLERTAIKDAETQRDRDELADVRAALARFKAGTYGVCIDCAQPMDLKRLTALPAAARCMPCQTLFESRMV